MLVLFGCMDGNNLILVEVVFVVLLTLEVIGMLLQLELCWSVVGQGVLF